jgi:predicted HTH domain antitoxin
MMEILKMKFQVKMEFNEDVLPALRKTPEEFAGEVRFLAAAKWYELGLVSQEKAAEIAGLDRMKFILAVSRIGISPFQYTAEAVLKEVEYVRPSPAE